MKTAIKKWWNAKSDLFTTMCATERGESFTHGDVVLAHLFLLILTLVIGIVGLWEGGAI